MGHDRIYCYDFHGVRFDAVPDLHLSNRDLPNAGFYAAIYDKVTPDLRFIESKRIHGRMIAGILAEHASPGTLLSWGAGTGLIESELIHAGWTIDAVEPGTSEHWPAEARKFADIDAVPVGQYDVVMTVSTLYSQTDADCMALLHGFAERVRPGGLLLIAEQDSRSLVGAIRGLLARRIHTPKRGAQFWGYLRGPSWYRRKTPLRHLWSCYYGLNPDWSYRLLKRPLRLFDRQLFTRRSRMQFHLFEKG